MKRIQNLKLGMQRLLLVISGIIALINLVSIDTFDDKNSPELLLAKIAYTVVIWLIYWLLVRIIIWIYDGFKN